MVTDDRLDQTYVDGIVSNDRIIVCGLGFFGESIKQYAIFNIDQEESQDNIIKVPITYRPVKKVRKEKLKNGDNRF